MIIFIFLILLSNFYLGFLTKSTYENECILLKLTPTKTFILIFILGINTGSMITFLLINLWKL